MRAMARSSTTDATSPTRNGAAVSRDTEHAKSMVMAAISELVDDGKAKWTRTPTGEVELRLLSGAVFLLGELFVTRVA